VWDILKKYKVWFKRSAAPVKKISLSTMGFWVNVHPSFASANVFRHKICTGIENHYPTDPTLLTEHNFSENYTAPEIYLNRCKLNTEYSNNDGTKNPTVTEALVMYPDSADLARSMTLLTQVSPLRTPIHAEDPFFIRSALKVQNPAKFGRYTSKQNNFLNQHRNIVIVGVVLEAMDYRDKDELSLYDMIQQLLGVYRCDLSRRTHDLGKWNISCNLEHHTDICTWIDTHMVEI
jgi:hypothetical protein